MKTAIMCPVCYKPKRYSDSYAVKIYEYDEPEVLPGGNVIVKTDEPRKIRVCRACVKRMGYKVRSYAKKKKK